MGSASTHSATQRNRETIGPLRSRVRGYLRALLEHKFLPPRLVHSELPRCETPNSDIVVSSRLDSPIESSSPREDSRTTFSESSFPRSLNSNDSPENCARSRRVVQRFTYNFPSFFHLSIGFHRKRHRNPPRFAVREIIEIR